MENYFNYFTEIEERFLQRRGGGLLLSTLDWALIETWKDAGIPLEAVLRGIDAAFDRYEQRPQQNEKGEQPGLLFTAGSCRGRRYEGGCSRSSRRRSQKPFGPRDSSRMSLPLFCARTPMPYPPPASLRARSRLSWLKPQRRCANSRMRLLRIRRDSRTSSDV